MISSRILLCLLLLLPPTALAKPLSTFVDSGEVGQAILLHRLGSCYAITPAHVIDGGFFATLVGGLPSAPQGEADVLMTFGYDLALLRVSGGVEADCKESFQKIANMDKLFGSASTGHLLTVRSDGSIARQQVSIVDTGMLYVHVAPTAGGEPLMKGMSGSLLEVDDRPAGLLMSVDPETGNGKVLRYDRVTETIAPFFAGTRAITPANPAKLTLPTAASQGYSVTRWTSPPLNAESRAMNLLDGNPASRWYARAQGFPLDIEIKLSDDKAKVVGQVELVSQGVAPQARLVRDFEIMVSTKTKGGWVSVAHGTLFPKDPAKQLQFAPVRGKRLLLRIHSNWGDAEAVGLSGITIQ